MKHFFDLARFQLILICFACLLLVISCSGQTSSSKQNTGAINSYGNEGLLIVSTTIQELTNSSDIVVIGQITPTGNIINMARNVSDINQSSQTIFGAGKVYQVSVESYVKGQGTSSILIVQPESLMTNLTTLTPNAYERGKTAYNAIIPKINTRYLLFLRGLRGFPTQQYYVGVSHPWRFDLSDPSKVIPEDTWKDAVNVFPPQPLATILPQIHTISANLSVSVIRTNVTLPSGQGVEYEITCSNTGPDTATGVFVGIEFPYGLTFDHSSGGNFNRVIPVAGDWNIGSLASGQSMTLVITTRLNTGTVGTVNFTAYTSGTSSDPNRTNNKVVDSFTIPTNLKLQYYPDPDARGNIWESIGPDFNIVNTNSTAIPLTELKIRYYFTRDGSMQPLIFNCWYTDLPGGCSTVKGIVVNLGDPVNGSGADSFLEVSFTSGSVPANGQTYEILVDIHKQDWSNFIQSNDYSFRSSGEVFTDWNKITLYRNGVLMWGTPPAGAP